MKVITFATYEEAAGSLGAFHAKSIKPGLYTSDIGLLAITGIGSFAAFTALKQLSVHFDLVVNIGLAGSLWPELERGSIHPIKSCSKHLWHPKGQSSTENCLAAACKDIAFDSDGLRLASVDFPLYDAPTHLSNISDLVDMEGYGLASCALDLGKPCELYKLVSDHCTQDSGSIIKNNLSEYSRAIAAFLHNKYK